MIDKAIVTEITNLLKESETAQEKDQKYFSQRYGIDMSRLEKSKITGNDQEQFFKSYYLTHELQKLTNDKNLLSSQEFREIKSKYYNELKSVYKKHPTKLSKTISKKIYDFYYSKYIKP